MNPQLNLKSCDDAQTCPRPCRPRWWSPSSRSSWTSTRTGSWRSQPTPGPSYSHAYWLSVFLSPLCRSFSMISSVKLTNFRRGCLVLSLPDLVQILDWKWQKSKKYSWSKIVFLSYIVKKGGKLGITKYGWGSSLGIQILDRKFYRINKIWEK